MPPIQRQIKSHLIRSTPSLSSRRTGGRVKQEDLPHLDPSSNQSRKATKSRRSSILNFSLFNLTSTSGSGSNLDPSIPLETETDPHLFSHRSRINLVQELSANSAAYQTWPDERAYVDVYGWNDKYDGYLDIIREMVQVERRTNKSYPVKHGAKPGRNTKPGMDPCIACCIQHGAHTLTYHEAVFKVANVRIQARRNSPKKPEDWEVMRALLDGFKVEVSAAVKGSRVRPCMVPPETKQLIVTLSEMTGQSQSALAHLSIQLVLCTQVEVYEKDRKAMGEVVSHFLKTSRSRALACETLMGGLWK